MAFVTGLLLIDAPASALNNLGAIPGEREDNTVGVKVIRTKDGYFPYVSAQAYRYWLRTTLEARVPAWKAAPIYREEKVAYTDANPMLIGTMISLGICGRPPNARPPRRNVLPIPRGLVRPRQPIRSPGTRRFA